MKIQHNIMAMNAYRNYNINTKALSGNLEKLSSGYKINRAGDDAAGLAISEKMRAQITGLDAAQKNVKDGISLVKTAEGAMQEIQDMLNRMDYLATQSANGTYDDPVDRLNLNKEVEQLKSEINRIADSANFNGIKLLDGKTGLNTDAFTVLGKTDAAEGKDLTSEIITTAMPDAKATGAAAGTDTILHTSGGEAQKGEFTVDLSQMKLESADGKTGDATVTIGGVGIDITAANAGDTLDGKAIATAVKGEIDKLTGFAGIMVKADGSVAKGEAAAADNKGALLYTATDNGDGTLTFKATQYSDGTAWKALTGDLPNSEVVDGACISTGWSVSVAAKTAANVKSLTGNPNIDATNTSTPKKAGETTFGNTFLTIDLTKLADGTEMTIAGETKVIGAGKDIDLSDLDLTTAAGKADAMDRITQAFADNQHVSVGQDAANVGKLTLAEKTDGQGKSEASAEMQEKMSTIDGFKSLVSFKEPSAKAEKEGIEIQIDDNNVNEGDTLNINGTKYVFTTKSVQNDTGNTKYVDISSDGAQEALLKKLGSGAGKSDAGNLVVYADANGKLPGVLGRGLTLQIGDTADDYNQLGVSIGDMHVAAMGGNTGIIADINIGNQQGAADAIQVIKDAINYVSGVRGDLGALQNRLEHTGNNLSVMAENIQDAESTIRDTDVANEMMSYVKNNILVQSAQAMLAQANQVPQGVLQLLG